MADDAAEFTNSVQTETRDATNVYGRRRRVRRWQAGPANANARDYCNCMGLALYMKVTLPPRGAGWRMVRIRSMYSVYWI